MKNEKLAKNEKEILWSNIESSIRAKKAWQEAPRRSARFAPFLLFGRRTVLAFVLIFALFAGSGAATVAAADKAGPGDLLFPLDIALEKIRITFADETKKNTLRIQFAEERLKEVRLAVSFLGGANEDTGKNTEGGTGTTTQAAINDDNGTTTADDVVSENTATATHKEGVEEIIDPKKQKKMDKANRALAVALANLEKTKAELEGSGADAALIIINDIIGDLENLKEGRLAGVESIKVKVRGKGKQGLKVALEASGNKIEAKLKFGDAKKSKNKEEKKWDKKRVRRADSDEEGEAEEMSDAGENDEESTGNGNGDNDGDGDNNDDDSDSDDGAGNKNGHRKSSEKEKITICHTPPGNPERTHIIRVGAPAARGHLAHGDTLGACGEGEDEEENNDGNDEGDENGGNGTTTPDIIAPIVSILAAEAETTTAAVNWTTDEPADSMLWYGTTTPVDTNVDPRAASTTLKMSHVFELSGLAASTTYYFIASSADASGNRATSSEQLFTTE